MMFRRNITLAERMWTSFSLLLDQEMWDYMCGDWQLHMHGYSMSCNDVQRKDVDIILYLLLQTRDYMCDDWHAATHGYSMSCNDETMSWCWQKGCGHLLMISSIETSQDLIPPGTHIEKFVN